MGYFKELDTKAREDRRLNLVKCLNAAELGSTEYEYYETLLREEDYG